MADESLIELTADIVSAHVSHNMVPSAGLPALISSVFAALSNAAKPPEPEAPAQEPAVTIRASVKHDHIVCLEDGKKVKMLKRHLRINYGMTPDAYRAKWNLPRDYPMVAPGYAAKRSALAKEIGLGRRKPDEKKADAKPPRKPRAEKVVEAVPVEA